MGNAAKVYGASMAGCEAGKEAATWEDVADSISFACRAIR